MGAKKCFRIWIIPLIFLLIISLAYAQESKTTGNEKIIAHFFYGDGCPHCNDEKPVLDYLQDKYPHFEVISYETWYNKENARLFIELSEACGTTISGVPTLFIDEEVIVGFSKKTTPKQIEDKIIECSIKGCIDPVERMSCDNATHHHTVDKNDKIVVLPLFGTVDTSKISLPVFTFIIGFLDGFNPCAMWVLTFLLTLLIYAKSRKKILLIGGIFVFTSGLIYFIFMAAWLNFFLLVGYVGFIRTIIAVIAIIAGLINIKDFFWFKKGVSLTIPDKYKPKLFSKMRVLVKEEAIWPIIIGSVLLAVFANLIELLCTAGFPAIYTRILTLQNMNPLSYYLYLVFYNIVYVIPLGAIVTVFAITMGAHKFTEHQGKILKIIGGLLMLSLGIILLLKPELLNF